MRVSALISDFDGTLCPTTSVKFSTFQKSIARIPQEVETSLIKISQLIPISIISSKDFNFLHTATKRFAGIISCVLGIETINHIKHKDNKTVLDCIIKQHFNADMHTLTENSKILSNLLRQEKIQNYKHDICIELKFTSCNKILIGITFDYRHLDNWETFKKTHESRLLEIIRHTIKEHTQLGDADYGRQPYIQTYTSHPFLDLYAVKNDKGLAFDYFITKYTNNNNVPSDSVTNTKNVLYLGDSENDNPAFRRSDISIGISSDKRLNPKLVCQYNIEFDHLSLFLNRLLNNDLIFSENLLKF
jgi:hypothetical protein